MLMTNGAGNGVRTRDTKLGKLVLYQLSYARKIGFISYDKTELLSIYLMINLNFPPPD